MTMSDATVYVSYENGVVEVDDAGDLLGICIGYSAETEKLVPFTEEWIAAVDISLLESGYNRVVGWNDSETFAVKLDRDMRILWEDAVGLIHDLGDTSSYAEFFNRVYAEVYSS